MARINRRIYDNKTITFNFIAWFFILCGVVFCLFPILIIVSGSFTSEKALLLHGHNIYPREVSLEAYNFVFRKVDSLMRAYENTIVITILGTFIGLLCITMAA